MLEWLKRKAAEKQEANVRETVAALIAVANEAYATIQRLGDAFPQQHRAIVALQRRLSVNLIGPVPLDELRHRIIDPALDQPGVTEGARMAVYHVCDAA